MVGPPAVPFPLDTAVPRWDGDLNAAGVVVNVDDAGRSAYVGRRPAAYALELLSNAHLAEVEITLEAGEPVYAVVEDLSHDG